MEISRVKEPQHLDIPLENSMFLWNFRNNLHTNECDKFGDILLYINASMTKDKRNGNPYIRLIKVQSYFIVHDAFSV